MQELEKILEEIDEKIEEYVKQYSCSGCVKSYHAFMAMGLAIAKGIIVQQMNGKATNVPTNNGWIPVEEALPPNAKHEGKLYPKYQVTTKRGVTEGWYDHNKKGWYVLAWFRELDGKVDFDKGNILKISFLSDEANRKQNILTAWQPLPEPWKGEEQNDTTRD